MACVKTQHPGGPIGVASKLKGLLRHSHVEIFGLYCDCRNKLRVNSIWGRSTSQRNFGKLGSTPARTERKCAFTFPVLIARSRALCRCISGGTSWSLHVHLSVMFSRYALLALLSNTCSSPCKPAALMHSKILLCAAIWWALCLSGTVQWGLCLPPHATHT
jgi:hypothetical protein